MKTGMFIVEGGIGDINEKIFKKLEEAALMGGVAIGDDAIEEAGGVPVGVKVKNNHLTLNKGTNLLHARVVFAMKL